MNKTLQIDMLQKIFRSLNPEADPYLIDWEHELDEILSFPENRASFAETHPGYLWYPIDERGLSEEAQALEGFTNYLETQYRELPKRYKTLVERGKLEEALALIDKLERQNIEQKGWTDLYKMQRDEARRKAPLPGVSEKEIEADIRRRAARERKPRVPLYQICPVHRTEMERVTKMPIVTERGVTAPPNYGEMPELFKIIRTRPGEIPPRISLIPVPDTMEIYYCEEGNRFYERMNAKSKEQSAAFLLRKIERERARVARIAAPPGVPYYPPGTPAAIRAKRVTIEQHEKWPGFLAQMGLTKSDYIAFDGLSKRGLIEAFRVFLRERGIY